MANFELATKMKFRFPYRGMIGTEDLWDLSLVQLDSVYKALNKELKAFDDDSLMDSDVSSDYVLREKIAIVKFIFDSKKDEAAKQKEAIENAKKKQRILEILAKKQDESLLNASEEDLLKMLENM